MNLLLCVSTLLGLPKRYSDEQNASSSSRNSESAEEATTGVGGERGEGYWLSSFGTKQPELKYGSYYLQDGQSQ